MEFPKAISTNANEKLRKRLKELMQILEICHQPSLSLDHPQQETAKYLVTDPHLVLALVPLVGEITVALPHLATVLVTTDPRVVRVRVRVPIHPIPQVPLLAIPPPVLTTCDG